MAGQDWVSLRHPKVAGTYRAPLAAVEHYRKRGWVLATAAVRKQVGVRAPKRKKEGGA